MRSDMKRYSVAVYGDVNQYLKLRMTENGFNHPNIETIRHSEHVVNRKSIALPNHTHAVHFEWYLTI